jgi:predicted RNA-binding protein with PUA-like domain
MRPAEGGGHPEFCWAGARFARVLEASNPATMTSTWLMKSEPEEASIDHLQAAGTLPWTGVRNYQARNFMRDAMRVGDRVLFYHSSCAEPGIAGLAEVCSGAYADPTQFDASSRYFDAKSSPTSPRWQMVDVRFMAKTPLLSLAHLRSQPELASLQVLQRGSRLSITLVSPLEWRTLAPLLGVPA